MDKDHREIGRGKFQLYINDEYVGECGEIVIAHERSWPRGGVMTDAEHARLIDGLVENMRRKAIIPIIRKRDWLSRAILRHQPSDIIPPPFMTYPTTTRRQRLAEVLRKG